MSIENIRPQVIVLGGFPGAGKSTVARTLCSEFCFPACQIVSYDKIRKELHKENNPDFNMRDELPRSFFTRRNKLEVLRRIYGRSCAIVGTGKLALLHMGALSKLSRAALAVGTFRVRTSKFWLEADYQELQTRLDARRVCNLSHGGTNPEVLADIFKRPIKAPRGWHTISTQGVTPSQVAQTILDRVVNARSSWLPVGQSARLG